MARANHKPSVFNVAPVLEQLYGVERKRAELICWLWQFEIDYAADQEYVTCEDMAEIIAQEHGFQLKGIQ